VDFDRRGLDEAALDITSEVLKRARSMPIKNFSGHVIGFEMVDENENDSISSHWSKCADESDIEFYHIMVGSQIVAEIRAAVEKETGFQCSSGIASNVFL
jgi:nucleotidyltransferase/DNA polymerase involved in DNA repair